MAYNDKLGRETTAQEEDWLRRNPNDEGRMAQALGNTTSHRRYDSQTTNPNEQAANQQADQGVKYSAPAGGSTGSVMQSWAAPAAPQPDPVLQELLARQKAQEAANKAKADSLYGTLTTRANRSLAIDRNDPMIRKQSDAYAANEQRAAREHMADMAESAGPTANLLGEERLMTERVGQRTGSFEAELMGRELQARRQEIADALTSLGEMLSLEQQQGLQRELASLDARLKEQQIAQGDRGLDLDWRKALMANDQFARRIGLDAEDRAAYWDAVRRGIL